MKKNADATETGARCVIPRNRQPAIQREPFDSPHVPALATRSTSSY